MNSVLQWLVSRRVWIRSSYSDLPTLALGATPLMQHWLMVAGGLALILSRAQPAEIAGSYASTRQLHGELRRSLRLRQVPAASAELLNETMHEIARIADPLTRTALRACFDHAVKRHDRENLVACESSLTSSGTVPPLRFGRLNNKSWRRAALTPLSPSGGSPTSAARISPGGRQ